jgi:hypothetical protein
MRPRQGDLKMMGTPLKKNHDEVNHPFSAEIAA